MRKETFVLYLHTVTSQHLWVIALIIVLLLRTTSVAMHGTPIQQYALMSINSHTYMSVNGFHAKGLRCKTINIVHANQQCIQLTFSGD